MMELLYFGGGAAVMLVGWRLTKSIVVCGGALLVFWFGFVWLNRRVMRCPSCGAAAEKNEDGLYIGGVGTRCRQCGKEY
jgi:uncharacterized membrane protein